MLNRLSHTQLLRYAGLFTWAALGIPLVVLTWYLPLVEGAEGGGVASPRLLVLGLAYAAFGLIYWQVTYSLGARKSRSLDVFLLAALTLSAIVVSNETGTGMGAVLMMVIAGVIPWLVPLRIGVIWLVLQHLALIPVFNKMEGFTPGIAVLQAMAYVGYSSFAMVIGLVAKQQAQARDEQRRLNAELRATRALLAESSRMSERVRISRELHDLLGHHLTALSLNLEVASHITEGKAHEHVGQAHTLARLLLSDVREAVSQIRGNDAIDMSATLLPLADNVPGLHIDMVMPKPFLLDDPERAHVLLRCTQEIITNAVRHAQAQVLRLRYGWDGEAIRLQARDDGRGTENPDAGNGLAGMRERLQQCGGQLQVETRPGEGFRLRATVPATVLVAALTKVPEGVR